MSSPFTSAALLSELTTDPLGLGYAPLVAAGNHAGLAGLLNALTGPGAATVTLLTVPKSAFASTLALAIGRVYAPGFAGNIPYWQAVLTLWTSLDSVVVADPGTQAVIAAAIPAGVLLPAEVAALTQRTGSRAEVLWGAGAAVSFEQVGNALRGTS